MCHDLELAGTMDWIDAHTHLDADQLYSRRRELLDRASAAGLKKLLLVNSEASRDSFQRTLEIAALPCTSQLFVSLGIHPHHASAYSPQLEHRLLEDLKKPLVVALGEIGLDYYYNYSPKEVQVEVLKRQLTLSLENGLPIVIHCREAYHELADILRSQSNQWTGMIHCFTGNREEADLLLDLGFYISFSGIVTFRNAGTLHEAVKLVPVDRMLIETDAPYLAPVPKRGKVNEPAFVVYTGEFLAHLKEMQAPDFAQRVLENFESLFPATCSHKA